MLSIKSLILPYDTDVDMHEDEMEVDDIYEIVSNECHNFTGGVQSLVSMKKIKNTPKAFDEQTSTLESMDSQNSIPSTTTVPGQDVTAPMKKARGRPRKNPQQETAIVPKRAHQVYRDPEIIQLIDRIQNITLNAAEAGRDLMIPERTAQRYWKRFVDGEPYLPSTMGKSPSPSPTLQPIHTAFLQAYYDTKSDATLKEAQQTLAEKFKISITQSGLQKHLYRNSDETIAARMNWAHAFESSGIDYYKCIFIDEAGFNMYIKRNFGRSKRGTPAKALVSKSRGVNMTIIGGITGEGIVNLSLRRPQAVVGSKKRKLGSGEEKVVGKIGTRAEHYIDFLEVLMGVLKENGMDGRILVMDNAAIHKTPEVREAVKKQGFEILYLPPYSPFLNPIEEFWSKLKAGVKRHLLTTDDTLLPRIIDSANQITTQDCQGWIRHSLSFVPRCINAEKML
ncbi:hypothetical protein INT45_013961 [Circinella minor]|uniref:Tc1-like transposase DDE domain-containing protein n=1 Tax=Circinella minor TaxID=1195481 RepID=A0A8H7RWM0_9FUNG|nr:hypothetical protein INT45_013961 [Circinella minor]